MIPNRNEGGHIPIAMWGGEFRYKTFIHIARFVQRLEMAVLK
jgi:hypothetical protein